MNPCTPPISYTFTVKTRRICFLPPCVGVFIWPPLSSPVNKDHNTPLPPEVSLVSVNTRKINDPNNRAYKMLVAESVLLTQYCSSDKIENEMDGACSAYGGEKRRVQGFGGKPEVKRRLGRPRCRW
jgi:hypothetical protein